MLPSRRRYRAIRDPNWQLDVHGIFPNLLLEVAPTFFYAIELIPISPTRTRWISHHYLPKAENPCQRFSQEYNVAAFRDTVAEDLAVLGTLQASMMSVPAGPFTSSRTKCCAGTATTRSNATCGRSDGTHAAGGVFAA